MAIFYALPILLVYSHVNHTTINITLGGNINHIHNSVKSNYLMTWFVFLRINYIGANKSSVTLVNQEQYMQGH